MRNQSPLFSPAGSKKQLNDCETPQCRHYTSKSLYTTPFLATNSTNVIHSDSPSSIIKPTLQPLITKKTILRGNYFKQIMTPIVHQHSPARVLFKSGYEYQEELKILRQENQDLKQIVEEQRCQLEYYLQFENVFRENQELKQMLANRQ